MARIEIPDGVGIERHRLWQLSPDLGRSISAMGEAVSTKTTLSPRLREIARMRIAQINGCHICLNTRSDAAIELGLTDELYRLVDQYATTDEFTPAEKLAAEYAERFALDHTNIDDAFWERMRAAFNPREIMELSVTIGFCIGIGRTLAVLDVAHECAVDFTREPVGAEGAWR
jgi:AhpD family alkylhydroperoxidase